MSDISYYTKEGLDKLKAELKHMKTVLRPSISEQIGEAIDKGDLSENAEYDAAKEAQGLLEAKINRPKDSYMMTGSKKGLHTELLGKMLAEMQYLPRAYPDAKW